MATTTKEILAKLKLDSKEFVGKLDESHKSVLKITAGMTAISAAVVTAAKFTANYRDEVLKASRAAGSSVEDFSALRHAADLSGVSMDQLAKGLRKLNSPSDEAKKTMASLGVSLTDASGQMKTQSQLLYDVADAIKGIDAPAQKSAATVAIFGGKAAGMINMLNGGSAELQKLTAEAERMGLTFDTKAALASELFNDNIQRVTGSVKGLVMTLTDGIIELVNTSGIMDTLAKAVQGVTGWWKSLDDSTKSTIVTIGAVVAGIAALILGVSAIIAIAPAVGAAITTMTGGLNLVVVAIAAAIAAFAAIAVEAITYWDQVKTAVDPALQSIKDAIDDLGEAVQPIADLLSAAGDAISDAFGNISSDFLSWLGITDDMTGKISVLGTIAKAVFAGIGAAIIIVIGVFQTLNNTIELVGTAIEQLGVAFYEAIVNQDFDAAKAALSKISDAAQKLKDDFVGMGDRIKQSFSNIVVTVDASKAKKSLKDFENDLNRIGGTDEEPAWIKSMKKYVGLIGGTIQQLGGMLGQVADMISAPIQEGIARNNRNFEIMTGRYSQMMEEMIASTEAAEDEKIARLSEKYDQQIAALKNAEKRKNDIISFAANERLLMMDAEYQAAKELAEQQFLEKMEIDAANYELEKEFLLQKAIDKEQRAITEEIMDQDFKLYMENQQALHDQKMNQMAKDYAAKVKTEDAATKATLKANEELSKETIKAITEQKNNDLEKAEELKNAKLKALEEKKQRDEKLLKKAQILMNWKAEQSEFKSTQGMKIAQTVVSGVAGAAQAFAMAAGTIPIVGIILGAVLAAAVLAMTFASVAQMAMQQPPAAPAALFLATGGVMDGPSHAAGGIYANLEGGEGVIDKARTEKLINSIDEATGSSKGLQIIFQPGAIVNNGEAVDDSFIDRISYAISRRLERQGVYA